MQALCFVKKKKARAKVVELSRRCTNQSTDVAVDFFKWWTAFSSFFDENDTKTSRAAKVLNSIVALDHLPLVLCWKLLTHWYVLANPPPNFIIIFPLHLKLCKNKKVQLKIVNGNTRIIIIKKKTSKFYAHMKWFFRRDDTEVVSWKHFFELPLRRSWHTCSHDQFTSNKDPSMQKLLLSFYHLVVDKCDFDRLLPHDSHCRAANNVLLLFLKIYVHIMYRLFFQSIGYDCFFFLTSF